MVRARLFGPDAATGFILDGYPRTVTQVDFLDDVLAELGTKLDCVITLAVDVEEVVRRLLRRAAAEGRSDDTEEVIRHRLKLFAEQTAPLAEVYEDRGLLTRIDGMGPFRQWRPGCRRGDQCRLTGARRNRRPGRARMIQLKNAAEVEKMRLAGWSWPKPWRPFGRQSPPV